MKIALLFLFALAGFVSSQEVPEYQVLEDAADNVLQAFAEGLDEITPLSGSEDDAEKVKSELVKMLQDALHKTVQKIKDRIDHHHGKAQDLLDKAHDLARRLKAHHADLGTKTREAINKLSAKAKEHLKSILDSFKKPEQREKRSLRESLDIHRRAEEAAQRICERLIRLVPESRKAEAEATFKKHIMAMSRLLEKLAGQEGHDRSRRSTTNEVSEAVKNFFRDLKISFKEKYGNFAEWLKESYKNGLNKATNKTEQLKEIARQVKEKAKDMKESTIREAIEVLEPYKKQLGSLWTELLEEAKKAIKAKHE